jgi:hypothetical protein
VSAAGLSLDDARQARREKSAAEYAASVLAAETGCRVRPCEVPGRFEAVFASGVLIGTAEEIRAWHRQSAAAGLREAGLREWLAVLGRQGAA